KDQMRIMRAIDEIREKNEGKKKERKREIKEKSDRVKKKKGEQYSSKEKEGKKMTLFMGEKEMREALYNMRPLYLLMYKESLFSDVDLDSSLRSAVVSLLQEYQYVLPDDMPFGLPPIKGIEH